MMIFWVIAFQKSDFIKYKFIVILSAVVLV